MTVRQGQEDDVVTGQRRQVSRRENIVPKGVQVWMVGTERVAH